MSGSASQRPGAGWRRPPTAAERAELLGGPTPPAGRCADCLHLRLLRSGRELFVRCLRAETDPDYPRYPALPVVECAGHEPWREGP